MLAIVLVAGAAPALATYPGQNGRIAFHRFDPSTGLAYALYTANPDGSHVVRVAHVSMFGFSNWSADGKHLAYDFFDADGNEQIATVDPNGANRKRLTSGPAIHEAPVFSPDGSHIVFDYAPTFGPDFHTTLWIMNADGTDARQLGSPDAFDVEPDFSPDSSSIAFIRLRVLPDPPYQQNALFVMRADGTRLRRLTTWGQAVEVPSWSPDSQWIAYYNHAGGRNRSIYLIRPNGTENHVIYQGSRNAEGVAPGFSPDGTKIIFTCVMNNYRPSFDADICVMNTDGTDVEDITPSPGPGGPYERLASWGTAPLM